MDEDAKEGHLRSAGTPTLAKELWEAMRSRKQPPAVPHLEVLESTEVRLPQGATLLLRGSSFTIGRTDDADLCLADEGVSRTHLVLEQRGRQWWAIDRSTNGASLNEARLESEALLGHGDRLQIGAFVCAFRDPAYDNSLLFPVARALHKMRGARTDVDLVKAAAECVEHCLKLTAAVQLALLSVDGLAHADALDKILAECAQPGRPISLGSWRDAVMKIARTMNAEGASGSVRALFVDAGAGDTAVCGDILRVVRLRNQVSHGPAPDDGAPLPGAEGVGRLVEAIVAALQPLVTANMASGLIPEEYVSATERRFGTYTHRGLSPTFPFETRELPGDTEPGAWCAYLQGGEPPLCLAPIWASGFPSGSKDRELFSARTLTFGPAGTEVPLESITSGATIRVRLPPNPLYEALARRLADRARSSKEARNARKKSRK